MIDPKPATVHLRDAQFHLVNAHRSLDRAAALTGDERPADLSRKLLRFARVLSGLHGRRR